MAASGLGGRLVRSQTRLFILLAILTLLALAVLFQPLQGQPQFRLQIDPTVDRLLDPDNPARSFLRTTRELFGSEQIAIVAVAGPDFLSAEGLALIRQLHTSLSRRAEIQRVDSLASVSHSRLDADGFVVIEPYARLPAETEADIDALRSAIAQNPLVDGQLLSRDGRVAAFVLHYADSASSAFTDADYVPELKAALGALAPQAEIWLTGAEAVKAAVSAAVAGQMVTLLPLILALTGLVTAIAFRSIRGAFLTLAVLGVGLSWTLALMVLMDIPLTLVSAIMPPVVVTLGLAYAMHAQSEYLTRWRRMPEPEHRDQVVAEAINELRLPLLLTGITTVSGFLALLLNPLQAVREFAAFSALGVAINVFLALCVLPLLLGRCSCSTTIPAGKRDPFDVLAQKLAALALRRRRSILWVGGLVIAGGALGLTSVEVGTNYVRGFSEQHPIRADFENINRDLSGVNTFAIVLEGFVDDTFTDPEVLRSIQRLQAWLEEQPEVGATMSVVDHLQLIQHSFGEPAAGGQLVPDSAQEIKQLLLFGASSALNGVVDRRFATAQIVVRSYEENSARIRELLQRLEPQLARLPRRLEVNVTGDSVLLAATVEDIASGQWLTVGVAALVIYAVLATLFTSWRVAAVAMLPNLLPVAVYYGLLGLFSVPLNPTTSLIACIVLGVAVDDTIHFLVRFNTASRALADESKAVAVALRSVLRPVTFTTVALCAGFATLCLSPLQNQVQFGALAAATLAVAWVSDVLFTPALGSGIRLVTLWDVLRLDLGADPQYSIPLFAGLSSRQARTFALMSRIQEYPEGARIITQGDAAEGIYVILEGRLRAFLERTEGARELSIMERGTVMGEVGYFGQRRTASVESISPARLLVFNGADLDAMRERYPRIAATVYRNLNLAQAQRLANMAKMI